MLDVNVFDSMRIGLASADKIREWSHGEVIVPSSRNVTDSSVSVSSDLLAIGNVTAVSTSAFVTKVLSVIAAALKLLVLRSDVSEWDILSWQHRCHIYGTSRVYPHEWA